MSIQIVNCVDFIAVLFALEQTSTNCCPQAEFGLPSVFVWGLDMILLMSIWKWSDGSTKYEPQLNGICPKMISFFPSVDCSRTHLLLYLELHQWKVVGICGNFYWYLQHILNFASWSTKPKIFIIWPFPESLKMIAWDVWNDFTVNVNALEI